MQCIGAGKGLEMGWGYWLIGWLIDWLAVEYIIQHGISYKRSSSNGHVDPVCIEHFRIIAIFPWILTIVTFLEHVRNYAAYRKCNFNYTVEPPLEIHLLVCQGDAYRGCGIIPSVI